MAEPAQNTIEGTVEPHESAGLPQMDVGTFPSQLFWLVLTFGFLFVVLSRVTLPRIAGGLADRRGKIDGDLGTAEASRKSAADALSAYEAALAQARARAQGLAEENRKRVIAQVDQMKAAADAEAQKAMSAAESRIAAERSKAGAQVRASAAAAAADIVQRLTGIAVSADDAAAAVDATGKRG